MDGSPGRKGPTMTGKWPFAAGMIVSIAGLALGAVAAEAPAGPDAVTCTNPASGATWQIRIDYERHTVDANPAQISDAEIVWRDARDGGRYTLDRSSGNLTVVNTSSTGGYFLFDRCRLKTAG